MTEHTDGPWLLQTPEEDGSITIIADNLGGLVGAALCWPTEVETGGSPRVIANARLMRSAPDMLKALNEVLDYIHQWGEVAQMNPQTHPLYSPVQSAIAATRAPYLKPSNTAQMHGVTE